MLFVCTPVSTSTLFALDPGKAITQYVQSTWQTEQGLPQNSVHAIQQTRDGYLWLGTEEGLVRFDGVRFTLFNRKNTPELKHNFVWSLCEGKDGSLWIGTYGGGLARLKAGKFSSWTRQQGLADDIVLAIQEDRQGAVWIATPHGLNRFKDSRWTLYTTKDGLSSDEIRSLFEDRNGNLWIGTVDSGLNRYREGKFIPVAGKKELSDERVYTICEDREGNLWIGTRAGLTRMSHGVFSRFTTGEGLSGMTVSILREDRDGNLWIGTTGGLNRLSNGKLSGFTAQQGLTSDRVFSLYEDREGSLWVGTEEGGLNQLRDGKISNYTTLEGLSHNNVRVLLEDAQGVLWIGTDGGGVSRMHGGQFTTYSTREGLANNAFALHSDRQGTLWIGTRGAGLYWLRDGRIGLTTTKEGLSSNLISSFCEDLDGNLWIGTWGGELNRLRDGNISRITAKEGPANNVVRCLLEDREGNLWIGTQGAGLYRLRNGVFSSFTTKQGLSHDQIESLYEDPEGDLWIGTNGGGLNRFRQGKFTSFTTQNGLFDDLAFTILEDDDGNLWMSCNKGIFRVSKKELNDFAQGKIDRISSTSYDSADGMKNRECNGGSQPAGWKTRDGRLLFSTIHGVAIVDPKNLPMNEVVPPVRVEEVNVDGRSIPPENGVALPPGRKNFEFHYTALSFRSPQRVNFRYKLEGYDQDWVDAGTRRIAYYTNLQPRDYRFQVIACNDDGLWNKTGAAFSFSLKPYFYQTGWFVACCFLGAIGIGLGVNRIRIVGLKKLVEEKTRNLQEANLKLTEAQDQITNLLDRESEAVESIPVWSQSAAAEIAQVVGAAEIGIWILDGSELQSIGGARGNAPSLEEVKEASGRTGIMELEAIVPLTGTTGSIYGALRVSGEKVVWGDTERRLIFGFAHQLGSALEMQKMRQDLASAQEKRASTMQELHDRGIATVQLCPHCGRCYDHTVSHCKTDGAALQAPHVLPFRILDRYCLERLLGQGGNGTVYQAYDEKLKRFVAVKVLKREFLDDPLMKERWEREAHMIARLRHPGIMSLYDLGELADGSGFYVMEFLEGVDMARNLKVQGPATPAQAAEVLRQVGDALTSAHEAGVIHRDLKPANLFLIPVSNSFQVKVVDFGLAKSMREESSLTGTGVLVGSPSYMSPEQIKGHPLDQRSDLFSLASVAYELLTGTVAFSAESVPEVLMRVLSNEPAPLSVKLQSANTELEQVFAWALKKNREERPATVSLWVEKIMPLLRTAVSSASGWKSEALLAELPAPADPRAHTAQR